MLYPASILSLPAATASVNSSLALPEREASASMAARSSWTKSTKFSLSCGLPPRSSHAGYSQSRSMPSKLCFRTQLIIELMHAARFDALSAIVVKMSLYSSLKLKFHPPNASSVLHFGLVLCTRVLKR